MRGISFPSQQQQQQQQTTTTKNNNNNNNNSNNNNNNNTQCAAAALYRLREATSDQPTQPHFVWVAFCSKDHESPPTALL